MDLTISGLPLPITPALLVALAAEPGPGRPVLRLAPEAMERLRASRATVLALDASENAYYGINTGFGPLCNKRIPPADMARLQLNLLLSHAAGVGPAMPDAAVRLMLASKIVALARGYSGVSPEIVACLVAFYNADLLPVIPIQGSVGASGDLAPLAHLGLALIGLGRARLRGEEMDSAEALRRAGIAPVAFGPKDGLALLNGTQYIVGYSALTLARAMGLARAADIAAVLSIEALMGSGRPFDARLFAIRPSGLAADSAANIRALLDGSAILESHRNCGRVQDPYSLRCAAQVHGASRFVLANAWRCLEDEFSAVTDNPIIFGGDDVVSGGNFHGQAMGMQMDCAAVAIAEFASISERRVYLLLEGQWGLPKLLMRDTGINSGFMIPQYTAASLVSENKVLCHPATVDSVPTSLGQEDHVSMGSIAARKALAVLENAENVLGIEILCAAQGMDYRRPLRSSPAAEAVHAAIRAAIPHVEEDRLMAPDIAAATALVRSGALAAAAGAALGRELL